MDSLEGRKLLSHWAHPAEAPAVLHAELADRDDVRESPQGQTLSYRSVSTTGLTSGPAEPTRETAARPRSEPEAYGSSWDERSKDDAESSPGGTPAPEAAEIITAAATIVEPDSLSPGANDEPESHHQREVRTHSDSPPGFTVAAASSGTVEHLPSVPGEDEKTSAASPPTMPEPAPRPPHETGLEPEPNPDIESPRGAGLISQAQPFPDEILCRVADDLLDQFEDMGVLDAIDEVMTREVAAFGTACAATFGAIEMARRLHRRDPERNARRTPSGRMVPGLWPVRS